MSKCSPKILVGVESIASYCNIGKNTFYKLIDAGMPAMIIDGRWYAHTDNLDEFFRGLTAVSLKNQKIPEGVE